MAFNIGPRIGVEGEKELKEALKAIIAEFKTLDAQMKAMETAFKRGEKSQKAYTEYQEKNAKAMETLSRLTEEYSKWVEIASSKHGESSSAAERYRTEIAKVGEEQEKLKTRAKDAADAEEEFAKDTENAADALSALETALVAAGVTKGLADLKELMLDCSNAAKEFEEGMAAVSRTTGLEGSGLDQMAELLKELSTEIPITTTELANITATAGQLGIETQYLEKFVTVMAQLGTATEMSSEEAATLLAQLTNVTGTREYDRLGSVVAYLGDATAATTTKIVEMSQSMAASASVAGLNEREIAGIAASVASLGIESQAGGTAISTLLQTIYKAVENGGEELQDFANIAGMSARQFKQAWGEDAGGAFTAFIRGLNDTERNGKSAISVLTALGITNIRQTRAILGLSEAEDALATNIALANKAWDENTALGEKAGIMYNTTEAKFTKFGNSVNNLKIAIGEDLNVALAELADTGANAFDWAANFVNNSPGIVAAVTGLGTAVTLFTTGVTGLLVAKKAADGVSKLASAFKVLGATGFGKWGIIISGVVAALTALAGTSNMLSELTNKAKDLSEGFEEAKIAFEELSSSMDEQEIDVKTLIDTLGLLMSKERKTAADKIRIKQTIDDLNAVLPDLALNYDENADAITGLGDSTEKSVDAVRDLAKAMQDTERAEVNAARLNEIEQARTRILQEQEKALGVLDDTTAGYFEKWDATKALRKGDEELALLREEAAMLNAELEKFGQVSGTASETAANEFAGIEAAFAEFDEYRTAFWENDEHVKWAESVRQAIEGLGGPLDKLEASTDVTFKKIADNMANNLKYWQDLESGLDTLLSRNIEGLEAFVVAMGAQLGYGSEEFAAFVAEMNKASDDSIGAMIDTHEQTNETKAKVIEDFQDAAMGSAEQAKILREKVNAELDKLRNSGDLYTKGRDAAAGYAKGFRDNYWTVYWAAYDLAQAAKAGTADGQNSASPSKDFAKLGRDAMDGYMLGVEEKEREMRQTMMALAQRAVSAFGTPELGGNGFAQFYKDGVYDRMGGSLAGGSASATTNNKTTNFGAINFTINAQPGQSAQDIADAVMDAIQAEVERKGAVFA